MQIVYGKFCPQTAMYLAQNTNWNWYWNLEVFVFEERKYPKKKLMISFHNP